MHINSARVNLAAAALAATLFLAPAFAAAPPRKPVHLLCDSLDRPLGIDSTQPLFSWQLAGRGIRCTANGLQDRSSQQPTMLPGDKPDVWDSGRIASDKSFGVAYGGPELAASKRYYWRVEVWDKDGKPYPASDVSWWETGLLKEKLESPSGSAMKIRSIARCGNRALHGSQMLDRRQGQSSKSRRRYAARFSLQIPTNGPVKHADLFVTGEDTAAAWVNGKQVLETVPLPPWKQAPWKTYLLKDVTSDCRRVKTCWPSGSRYTEHPRPMGRQR